MDLHETFEKFNDDYLKFHMVENKLHSRPDICAFLLLDKLVPAPGKDMVAAGEHDEIFLETDCEELAKVATEYDIITLARCGVRYDEETDSLAMFV